MEMDLGVPLGIQAKEQESLMQVSQDTPFKRFLRKLKSRLVIAIIIWTLALTLLILTGVLLRPFYEVTEIVDIAIITIVTSLCTVVSIFLRYSAPERFPISAYLNIGLTYFFSFCTIGFLAIDIAFTRFNKKNDLVQEQISFLSAMTFVWNVVYFGNIICGTVLNKFLQKYWQSGHFSTCSKIKFALKKLSILLVGFLLLLIVLGFLFYFIPALHDYRNIDTLNSFKAVILVLSNFYGQLVMVLLLSYGLFRLPIFLWRRADYKSILMDKVRHAELYFRKYRDS